MSKISDKTFEKILDDMCKRMTEISTMECSYLGAHCATNAPQGCHEFANEIIASQCKFGRENAFQHFL